MNDLELSERIFLGYFLCKHSSSSGFLSAFKPHWNELIEESLLQKMAMLNFPVNNIFPWKDELSKGITPDEYCISFLDQPKLFLRIRPGNKSSLIKKLNDAGLEFEMSGKDSIALANSTPIDRLIETDKEAVVQDLNSQKALDYLNESAGRNLLTGMHFPITCWDCCAASGGKSILVHDILKGRVKITASDIRESSLANLRKRFSRAGIRDFNSFPADLSSFKTMLPATPYQLIICDVPCTGSGTWSRTPEKLFYFDQEMIAGFATRQQKIVSAAIPQLQKGGLFFYITCSVFKKENEEIAEYIQKESGLQLLQAGLLKGYDKKADTMYSAVFRK